MSDSAEVVSVTPQHTVSTHLGWAVASAVLCFLPLGIIAVLYAVSSNKALAAGDVDRAVRKATVAKRWLIVTIVVGLVVDLFLLAGFVLLGAFSS
jgi:VIT1/CCC1 family predicted Fe2+/Mn2+ transporter